jgi:hypothetical protein
MLRRAVISRVVLLVLALSRQFWLCSVYFSIRNPFIVANCIEERASRLDGEVLAGVLFGRSGGFPRPQNVLSIEESRGHCLCGRLRCGQWLQETLISNQYATIGRPEPH